VLSTSAMRPHVLRVDPEQPEASAIDEAASVLRGGGLVAFPTETVYGLGAKALDPTAVARIFAAKGRPATHPVIVHVLGESSARALARDWSAGAQTFARAFWPGPLTLVVTRAPHVPAALGGGTETIGIRAPAHPVARALLAALGEPIAAPSANRYQALSPTTAEHVLRSLGDKVDLILDGGPCPRGLESTVLDLTDAVPVVLRPGTVDLEALRAVDARTVYAATLRVPEALGRPSPGMDERHYAPQVPLILSASRADAIAEAEQRGSRGEAVALVLWGEGPVGGMGVVLAVLPDDPGAYARALYATLHDLEGRVASIVVQGVPEGNAWRAVADRLMRASTPRKPR
jgi:L-threonylcarbamoyladenylate synthase